MHMCKVYVLGCKCTMVVKRSMLISFAFPLDACDPKWRSTRDGLIGSAFTVSIVAFILSAAMIWTHIYYHTSKQIRNLRQLKHVVDWVQLFCMH